MKTVFFALSLALTMLPVAALADTTPPGAPPAPTAAQRQAMFQTFRAFGQKEGQLHQQMRSQMLSSLTPAHRTAVANAIGQLAISTNPNPQTAAKQLDALLSQSERQRILSSFSSFRSQSKTLHEQLKTQMRSEMPAGGPPHEHPMMQRLNHPARTLDAGTILLKVLGRTEPFEMGHHFGFMGGPPPPPHR